MDEPPIAISALQHWMVCPRQCGLIHLEQCWEENMLTTHGKLGHQVVDKTHRETRRGRDTAFGLLLKSQRLGLVGKADAVEFHEEGGRRVPFPVEHKHGRSKANDCDRVQLCAQALCLEEMLGVPVPQGALFYGKTRRREAVAFDLTLRTTTETAVQEIRAMLASRLTPAAKLLPLCNSCSLQARCLPTLTKKRGKMEAYLQRASTLEGTLD